MINFESNIAQNMANIMPDVIQEKAERILKDSGYENTFPCPIEKIINFLGYTSYLFSPTKDMKDVYGVFAHNSKKILISDQISPQERLFTAAHEVGHAVLHPQDDYVDFKHLLNNSDPKEEEADFFASCLLMPEKALIKQWKRFEGDIRKLSLFFGPNMSVVAKRAEYLKLAI